MTDANDQAQRGKGGAAHEWFFPCFSVAGFEEIMGYAEPEETCRRCSVYRTPETENTPCPNPKD